MKCHTHKGIKRQPSRPATLTGIGGEISNILDLSQQSAVTEIFQPPTNSQQVAQSIGHPHRVISARIGARIGSQRWSIALILQIQHLGMGVQVL